MAKDKIDAILEHRLQSESRFEDFLNERIKSLPEDTKFPCFIETTDFFEIFEKLSDLSVPLSRYMNVYFNEGGLLPKMNSKTYEFRGAFDFVDYKNGDIKISRFHEAYNENLGQTYILMRPRKLISHIDQGTETSFFFLLGKEKEYFLDNSRNPEIVIEKGAGKFYPYKEEYLNPKFKFPEHNVIINLHEENSFALFCSQGSVLTNPDIRKIYIQTCINKASSS